MQRQAIVIALFAAVALAAAITVGAIISAQGGNGNGPAVQAPVGATPTPSSQGEGPGLSTDGDCLSATEIYASLRPAVVEVLSRSNGDGFGLPQQGAGSGIIVDEDGSILTNHHVVANADSLEVRFSEGTVVPAQLIGSDPGSDLALIGADASGEELTVASLGSSADLRVGDPVLAIGSPFQLEGTLTQGIVSGLGRTFSTGSNTRPLRDLIQTDAAVNPGNSGGPLINCRGEVVGINTLLENPTGANVNVGVAFAVPIDAAKRSLPEMEAGETVQHPWLGIAGQELTPALARQLGLSTEQGVYVTLVAPNSPADEAGLRGAFASEEEAAAAATEAPPEGGDVIVEVDSEPVASVEELAAYFDENKRPGDAVELGIERDGEQLSLQATLAQWPA